MGRTRHTIILLHVKSTSRAYTPSHCKCRIEQRHVGSSGHVRMGVAKLEVAFLLFVGKFVGVDDSEEGYNFTGSHPSVSPKLPLPDTTRSLVRSNEHTWSLDQRF